MKVLITGAGGQLGRALLRCRWTGAELVALTRAELDVSDREAVAGVMASQRPDWVINAAAYTAVDRAESERAAAFAANAEAPGHLAAAVHECGGRLVQISTDFVFPGTQARPYRPGDPVAPVNVYGESKAAGEKAVRAALPERHLILRTAWVYSGGEGNFLATMLRLMRSREDIGVVDDQIGTPTSTASLAEAVRAAVECGLCGTHHWTDAGVASWFDFACAIHAAARAAGLLGRPVRVRPIPTSAFPTPARRPAFSVLDKSATRAVLEPEPQHWQDALRDVIAGIAA